MTGELTLGEGWMEGWLEGCGLRLATTYGALQVKGPVERAKGHTVATTSSLMLLMQL